MRRKLSYWALALLVPLGFVSCSQEEVAPQEQEINLNITAGGVQTRVNTQVRNMVITFKGTF